MSVGRGTDGLGGVYGRLDTVRAAGLLYDQMANAAVSRPDLRKNACKKLLLSNKLVEGTTRVGI